MIIQGGYNFICKHIHKNNLNRYKRSLQELSNNLEHLVQEYIKRENLR